VGVATQKRYSHRPLMPAPGIAVIRRLWDGLLRCACLQQEKGERSLIVEDHLEATVMGTWSWATKQPPALRTASSGSTV